MLKKQYHTILIIKLKLYHSPIVKLNFITLLHTNEIHYENSVSLLSLLIPVRIPFSDNLPVFFSEITKLKTKCLRIRNFYKCSFFKLDKPQKLLNFNISIIKCLE